MRHSPARHAAVPRPRPLALVLLSAFFVAACTGGRPAAPHAGDAAAIVPAAERERIFLPPPMPAPSDVRTARGEPGPGYWQQRCDYRIDARLDEPARLITARGVITYTNNSPVALSSLHFNLDQNLFNPATKGFRITKTGDRFGNRDGFDGGFQLGPVTVSGREVAMQVEETIGRIDLPAPVAARGGTVEIALSWSFRIPPYGSDRMGIEEVKDGPIFQIAQWFPNVCVYDDVHGWNTLPYLGQGEFYTNFGRYDVRITVPRSHVVTATGVLQNPEEVLTPRERERLSAARASRESVVIRSVDDIDEGRSAAAAPGGGEGTWHFIADDVRTFAWASSAAFAWDACLVPGSGPGSDGDPARGAGVLCQSFYPREAAHVWGPAAMGGGSTQMLRDSIEHYGRRWYAYPYPTASNVNGLVGGMEYPMVIFCGGGRASPDHTGMIPSGKDAERGLFGVTTHEIGHNWFPMLVSTDEKRHAWMDEGFNTFLNYYANLERYPDLLPRRGNARVWARDHKQPTEQPIDVPADELLPGTLGKQQYEKASVGLVLLREGVLGPEKFDPAFRAYIRRWAFKSPRPWDFFRTMEDVSGEDLGWFFRGWFYENGVLDQAVVEVVQAAEGDDDGRAVPMRSEPDTDADTATAAVVFKNRAQLVMPLRYRVKYDDGTEETRTLPATAWRDGPRVTDRWNPRGRVVTEVLVDPDEEMPDVELKNNRWGR